MIARKPKPRVLFPVLCAIPLLTGAFSALAQQAPIGTMAYGPGSVAIPLGGGFFLVLLGLLLSVVAYRKISRGGFARSGAASLVLALGAAVAMLSGGQLLQHAYAGAATVPLSNPQGGTVDIFSGYQEYENTSGEQLRINAINLDGCPPADGQPAGRVAYPECVPGSTVLEDGGICSTDYPPCEQGDRVTFRAGYYWVRADHRAALSEHAAICAEFNLAPTATDVTLTWDAALLQALSTDFGYLSNGDDDNSATSMWCWDGDGGPSTPGGSCETHNFGSKFSNYGYWGSDPDIRPVFTCTAAP